MTVRASRPPIRVQVTRSLALTSSTRLQNASQESVLLKPAKDPKFSLLRRLVDASVGPIHRPADSSNQTDWYLPKNYGTQYRSGDFQEKLVSEELSIDGAVVEAALQSNETLNVFAEDMPRARDAEGSSSSLRELRNFHDVTFTKGRRIVSVSLLAGKALASYAPSAPFGDLVEAEGQPKTAHFLLWNMNDALAPETVFSSTHAVTCFHLMSASVLLCGLSSGQVAVYSVASGTLKSLTHVNESHRRPVVALEAEGGRVLSGAGDGQTIIWEVGVGEVGEMKKLQTVQLTRAENATELSIAGLRHLRGSSFAVATEEGEVALCDWQVKTAAGDERKPEYVKHLSSTRTFRPTVAFDKSELNDALLLVTDWAAHIFRPSLAEPLISTPPPPAYYSCGAFSRTRAGVVYLGRVDGTLEVWDLTDQSNKPLMTFAVGSAALTTLAFDLKGEALAAGDEHGHLHVLQVPGTLQTPQARETQFVHKLLAIEERRVAHFRARFAVLAEQREEREKTDLLENQRAQVASESAGKGGFSAGPKAGAAEAAGSDDAEVKKMQAEYDALKKAFEDKKTAKPK